MYTTERIHALCKLYCLHVAVARPIGVERAGVAGLRKRKHFSLCRESVKTL